MSGGGPLGFDDDPAGSEPPRGERRAEGADGDPSGPGPPGRGRPAERAAEVPQRLTGGASQYGWFVALIGILLVVGFTVSNLGSDGPAAGGVEEGGQAPPFAAPIATSPLAAAASNQVNVATRANQGDAGNVPACSLRRPDVLNFCALYEAGPVVLAFFAANEECVDELDVLDAVGRRHPDVTVAAVAIRGDLEDVRDAVAARSWGFRVGYDDDGVLANAFGVAVCPQLTFVRRGGAVQGTVLGSTDEAELEARFRRLEG